NYLIRLRVQQAKELLETTNYSIAQISDSCGFSSQSYFSQVFKKACGMTPNAYRKSSDRSKVMVNNIL
ncbi:helix-turn-helix transcriptional regulator, partial [Erysipelatoclostridium ramosum]